MCLINHIAFSESNSSIIRPHFYLFSIFSGLPGRASSTTIDGGDGGGGDGGGGDGGRGGDGLDVQRGRLEGRDPEGVNVAGGSGRLLAVAWVRNGGIRISKQLQFVALIYLQYGDNIYTVRYNICKA